MGLTGFGATKGLLFSRKSLNYPSSLLALLFCLAWLATLETLTYISVSFSRESLYPGPSFFYSDLAYFLG